MTLLLDTHFLIWLVIAPERLTHRERLVVDREDLIVSAASIWELRIKWHLRDSQGNRRGLLDPALAVAFAAERSIPIAPLTAEDCVPGLTPPIDHRDPFDEMLLIHAQRLGARLLTRDARLLDHPVAAQR